MKTYSLFFGIFSIVLAAVFGPPTVANAAEDKLSMELSLDKEDYAWNDEVSVTVSLHNETANDEIWITFPDACYFDVTIKTGSGQQVAEEDSFCAQVLTEVKIVPGQTWELSEKIALDALAGLGAGDYFVHVESRAEAEIVEDNETVVVPTGSQEFSLTRPLLISYELSENVVGPEGELELSYTLKNEGGESFTFRTDCGPYLLVYDAVTGDLVYDQEEEVSGDCEETEKEISVEAGQEYSSSTVLEVNGIEPGRYTLELDIAAQSEGKEFWIVGEEGFVDIYGHWAENYIQELFLDGVVEGYDPYHFKPDQAVTRAEFLKIAFEAINLHVYSESQLGASQFSDVDENAWYYVYTESAYAQDIIDGYSDQTFAPNQSITRAEALSIALAAIGITDDEMPSRESVFTDVRSDWQVRLVMEAYSRGIVRGYRDSQGQPLWLFKPNNLLTRAEACKLAVEARNELTAD